MRYDTIQQCASQPAPGRYSGNFYGDRRRQPTGLTNTKDQ
jgi:hypothetical protein